MDEGFGDFMRENKLTPEQQDELVACADLVGRSGATEFSLAALEENVPVEQGRWWASAMYQGARIAVEEHTHPAAAARALAERLLAGARCTGCSGLVALSSSGAVAFGLTPMADGSSWDGSEAGRRRQCLWRRVGARWERACGR
ncbi:hypothetical protein BJF83_21500 [Nocardiopsis sp. CNR-923]|uniref:hypothetical protein n=1 Tax=Nocardiopsis sp. CNR-923 TaxID=1904965 RepID=UPI000965E054|nr:hypothetical protein [Nocardiopsis sp. CNR-923]OLT26379.1 hypothetical protein BJF83_21500 [Nocardiopsis sp. CNR-923]